MGLLSGSSVPPDAHRIPHSGALKIPRSNPFGSSLTARTIPRMTILPADRGKRAAGCRSGSLQRGLLFGLKKSILNSAFRTSRPPVDGPRLDMGFVMGLDRAAVSNRLELAS